MQLDLQPLSIATSGAMIIGVRAVDSLARLGILRDLRHWRAPCSTTRRSKRRLGFLIVIWQPQQQTYNHTKKLTPHDS